MEDETYKPREYFFNGKSIVLDKYEDIERERDEQMFDDQLISSQNTIQGGFKKAQTVSLGEKFKSRRVTSSQITQAKNEFTEKEEEKCILVPQGFIEELKVDFYNKRGYIQNDPKELFHYFSDYKLKEKNKQKIARKIQPLLKYRIEDVLYSLNYYYNESQNKQTKSDFNKINPNFYSTSKVYFSSGNLEGTNMSSNGNNNEQSNVYYSSFNKQTLRRLYPKQKDIEEKEKNTLNIGDFSKFFIKLIQNFKKDHGRLSNDKDELLEYWKGMNENEQKRKKIQWENGEENLEEEITDYLSDDEIIKRLIEIFKKICGYESNHPRPLHDYWDKNIPEEEKYNKGLRKYNNEEMYSLLCLKFEKSENEKKEKREKEEKEREEKEKEEKEKKKLTKEEYENLKKKFTEMSKPKDKWRTGRVMLKLKNQFQYDNIISKMIKYEFQDNKVFKFPEEYAVYDNDEQRKIIFKNSLEKGVLNKSKIQAIEERIQEQMIKTNDEDIKREIDQERNLRKVIKEDRNLNHYIKQMVIKYYKKMQNRLESGKIQMITKFLNNVYQNMIKNHKNATKRRFPKINYVLKKAYALKKKHIYYPESLKYYFFQLLRRVSKNENGKFVFAKTDNLSFWGPSLSNNCKVHKNECSLYCTHNSHNDMILQQRRKNFDEIFAANTKLEKDEKFNFWKRPEMIKEKEKIFLCLDEARHCTFEPKINKTAEEIAHINQMQQQELVEKRVNNMKWVEDMGKNFAKFPVVYKEGICKKAKLAFADGRYGDTIKLLEKAFDLEQIRAYFDPVFAKKLREQKRKEREEQKEQKDQKEQNEQNEQNEQKKQADVFQKEEQKRKVEIVPDDFKKPKNLEICTEVYYMLKEIDDFKKKKAQSAKRLKEEINIIEYNDKQQKNPLVESKNIDIDKKMSELNPQFVYVTDKYFNYFKTLMCPLKNQCPYILQRWPSSDINNSRPFGIQCPYAHQVSELKFKKEISEKIKLRKNLLNKLQEDKDPAILYEWVPTGPILSCNGCGKTFSEKNRKHHLDAKPPAGIQGKGLCGFCLYRQKNELDLNRDKQATQKANEKILKKIDYQGKPQEIDQDFVKKFGMLQKGMVLFSFRRFTDSMAIMDKLMKIIDGEKGEKEEKFKALDVKWRNKLEIKEPIPFEILNYRITQKVLNHFQIKTPLATLLLYCEKMKKGNKFSIFNRHTYLNQQIQLFYNKVKGELAKYSTDIKAMKRQINALDRYISNEKKLQTQNPQLYRKFKSKYKNQMCGKSKTCPALSKTVDNNGKLIECNCAHKPNELNLIKPKQDKNLMMNNLRVTNEKLKQSAVLVPWSYPKQNLYEQGLEFDKHLVSSYGTEETLKEYRRTRSAKKLKEEDLERLRIPYHEI